MKTLNVELWSIMCNGADENQSHCCDPYGPMVQEQVKLGFTRACRSIDELGKKWFNTWQN